MKGFAIENPYQSPEEPFRAAVEPPPPAPQRRSPGLVHHVRVVAILMLVQGGLELLAAIGIGVMAAVLPHMMQLDLQHTKNPPQFPPNFFGFLTALYGGAAAVALLAGLLHLAAGLQNYRFRGRVLGIVALAGGMLTFFTCYCLPTAIGLGVYGLIVYLNGEATDAFCMGESGCSADEIRTTFRR